MSNLTEEIYKEIVDGKNILLVGPTDSGKTWYVKNTLMPFLQEKNQKILYCSDSDSIPEGTRDFDILIIDEIETLLDQSFLEANSNDPEPYYSKEYLDKVENWHAKLKKLDVPGIFILTRNKPEEIKNLVDNYDELDWGAKVKSFVFERREQASWNSPA